MLSKTHNFKRALRETIGSVDFPVNDARDALDARRGAQARPKVLF
jgi:hypothetical protein